MIHPQTLLNKALKVKGLDSITNIHAINIHRDLAIEVAEDWKDEEEIGSSDLTFMLKEFIDLILMREGRYESHKADFTPYLSIVEK